MHCHSRLLTKLGVILNCLLCFRIMLDKWLDWYCYQSVRLSFNNARPGHLYTTKIDASSLLRKTVNMFNKMFKVFQVFKKRIKPSREQSRQGDKKSGQNRMWALWAEVSGGHSTDRSHRPTTPDQTNSAEETNSDKKTMLIQYREMPDMFGRGMPTFDMDLHLQLSLLSLQGCENH